MPLIVIGHTISPPSKTDDSSFDDAPTLQSQDDGPPDCGTVYLGSSVDVLSQELY